MAKACPFAKLQNFKTVTLFTWAQNTRIVLKPRLFLRMFSCSISHPKEVYSQILYKHFLWKRISLLNGASVLHTLQPNYSNPLMTKPGSIETEIADAKCRTYTTVSGNKKYTKTCLQLVHSLNSRRHAGNLVQSLVNKSPENIQAYLKLMRLHAPIGFLLCYWPAAWGVCLATSAGMFPEWSMLALILTGAVTVRGAGCTINDMIDRKTDAQVERTKNRPLATGQVSMFDALVFLGGQLGVGLLVLMQLNSYSILLGMAAIVPIALYPFAKYVFSWPQLMLGLTFNWGALIGWSAIAGSCDWLACVPLYLACISWTLFYDTIYALQDKRDDVKIGVKSTAVTFGSSTPRMLGVFTASMMAGLCTAGAVTDQTLPYYLSLALAGGHMVRQILTLEPENSSDCGEKFKANNRVGLIICAGIIAGTLGKVTKDTQKNTETISINISNEVTNAQC